MTKIKSLFLTTLLILSSWTFCRAAATDSTTIYGFAPSYAGLHLTAEYQANIITREREQIVNFVVKPNGSFKASFVLSSPTKIFLPLGKILGIVLIQPKASIEIALPNYSPLEEGDRMNPFFKPQLIPLAVTKGDTNQLNLKVSEFDDDFNDVYIRNIHKLFKKESEKPILKIIQHFDSIFPSNNEWFTQYKHFTYQKLYDLTFERRQEYIIDKFFKNTPFQPLNSAYADAFNATFYRYFALKFNSSSSKSLKNAWNSRSIDSISSVLKKTTLLVDDNLREAVILKNLYDAYYSNLYDKQEILDLIAQSGHNFVTKYNKHLANNILTTLNKLKEGSPAPDFNLLNFNDKLKNIRKYKGKFIYLNFVHTQNFACKKDLLSLILLHELTKKDLEIVTIVTDNNIDKAKAFVKENKFDWDFLNVHSEESILLDYKIRVLPTYFLIDPMGKLLLSPAPTPEENFLELFQEQAKAYKNKELRKNPPKQKSIFDL